MTMEKFLTWVLLADSADKLLFRMLYIYGCDGQTEAR